MIVEAASGRFDPGRAGMSSRCVSSLQCCFRSKWDAAKYLASGKLQVVMKDYRMAPADLFVFYPSHRNLPAKALAFIDFLAANIGKEQG